MPLSRTGSLPESSTTKIIFFSCIAQQQYRHCVIYSEDDSYLFSSWSGTGLTKQLSLIGQLQAAGAGARLPLRYRRMGIRFFAGFFSFYGIFRHLEHVSQTSLQKHINIKCLHSLLVTLSRSPLLGIFVLLSFLNNKISKLRQIQCLHFMIRSSRTTLCTRTTLGPV